MLYTALAGHGKTEQKVLTITKADPFYCLVQDLSISISYMQPKTKKQMP
jgi:hypothetical protein